MRIRAHVVFLGLVGLPACVTTPAMPEDAVLTLRQSPPGSYVSGAPVGVGEPVIINRRDFIYAHAFDRASATLAFVHHVSTEMELTLTGIDPIAPVFQAKLNRSEFDAEDVLFDGERLLVPSRQGILRSLARASGSVLQEVSMGEPLLRVARAGDYVVVSTTDGRVILFDAGLRFIGEAVLHDDEVRGLLALSDGRLVTASQDGTLKVGRVVPATKALVRVPVSPLPSGELVFVGHLGGTRAVAVVRDAREPTTVITRAAVKRLELPAQDGAELKVLTPEGEQSAPAVCLGELRLRALSVGEVSAAVCDGCVPRGAEIVLGQDVLSRLQLTEDVARGELVARPVDGVAGVALTPGAVSIEVAHSVTLPGPANDLDLSATGIALVTFSHQKAERSYEVHEAERKGDFPPPTPRSGAALVDLTASSPALGAQLVSQHLGFAVTGAISPDGKTVVTGGWDRRVLVWDVTSREVVTERSFAWLVRRLRLSPDGRLLGVSAWTPVNALNEGDSEPSMVLYPLSLTSPRVVTPRE